MNKIDLYEVVTQKIVECLKTGVVPWQIPWRTKNGMPWNMTLDTTVEVVPHILLQLHRNIK